MYFVMGSSLPSLDNTSNSSMSFLSASKCKSLFVDLLFSSSKYINSSSSSSSCLMLSAKFSATVVELIRVNICESAIISNSFAL